MTAPLTTLAAMVLLAGICWAYRILFIVLVPADRLPQRARDALGHLAPAVLAALVAVEADAAARGSDPATVALVLGSVLLVGVAARLTGSLALAITLGLGSALFIDLVWVA